VVLDPRNVDRPLRPLEVLQQLVVIRVGTDTSSIAWYASDSRARRDGSGIGRLVGKVGRGWPLPYQPRQWARSCGQGGRGSGHRQDAELLVRYRLTDRRVALAAQRTVDAPVRFVNAHPF
jgi:hypothetical protein